MTQIKLHAAHVKQTRKNKLLETSIHKLRISSAKCWWQWILNGFSYMPHELQIYANYCDDFLKPLGAPHTHIWCKFATQILATSLNYTDPCSVPGMYSFLLTTPVHSVTANAPLQRLFSAKMRLASISHVFSLNPIPLTLNHLALSWICISQLSS